MATPEPGIINRMEGILANILNREIDTSNSEDLALMQRITNRFADHWRGEFDSLVNDPANPTNSEMAGFYIKKTKEFGQDVLRSRGEREVAEEAIPVAKEAGEEAAKDMEIRPEDEVEVSRVRR